MIELVRDLREINVLAKFEKDPWKIMDVRVPPETRPPARPLGRRQYPGALKGCGVESERSHDAIIVVTGVNSSRSGASSDDKLGIMTAPGFQWLCLFRR